MADNLTNHLKNWSRAKALLSDDTAYQYYRLELLKKLIPLFKYSGVPDTIDIDFFESCILINGMAVVFEYEGDLIAMNASPTDRPNKYYICDKVRYNNPIIGSAELTDGETAVVCYNTQLAKWGMIAGSEADRINKYAELLAACDISLRVTLKNARLTHIARARDKQTVQAYKDLVDGVSNGANAVAVFSENDMLNPDDGLATLPTVTSGVDYMRQIAESREYLYNSFLSEYGLSANTVLKRERQLTTELDMQERKPEFNILSLLEQRKKNVEKINAMFGTNITVELAIAPEQPEQEQEEQPEQEQEEQPEQEQEQEEQPEQAEEQEDETDNDS